MRTCDKVTGALAKIQNGPKRNNATDLSGKTLYEIPSSIRFHARYFPLT